MRLFEKKICNDCKLFQSTHSLRSATRGRKNSFLPCWFQSTHSLRSATGCKRKRFSLSSFQSTHSLRSATRNFSAYCGDEAVSIHALLAECDLHTFPSAFAVRGFNPRTPCGVRPNPRSRYSWYSSVSIHALLAECDATDFIHYYSTEQIILCANLPKKTVIARLHFLSIYLSIFYSQCITPIADLPGNSCELEVGAQAMFHSL